MSSPGQQLPNQSGGNKWTGPHSWRPHVTSPPLTYGYGQDLGLDGTQFDALCEVEAGGSSPSDVPFWKPAQD